MPTQNSLNKAHIGALNKSVPPECLYCEKRCPDMGQLRFHMRLHIGIRPYKCQLCNYKHWYKTQMKNTHFPNVHGRKGIDTDVITNIEDERKLETTVEQDIQEIRGNQERRQRGENIGGKKLPPREAGAVDHDYYLTKYDSIPYPLPKSVQQESHLVYEVNQNGIPIPKLRPENNLMNQNSNHVMIGANNKIRYLPTPNGATNLSVDSNNTYQTTNHITYPCSTVQNDFKDLSIDKLLENDF